MPKIKIDNREVTLPPGATILDGARALGIDVPTLCFLKGYKPATSCLVCMVKVRGEDRLVPSCATRAEDGMDIDSQTPEVHQVRKTAIELLLSDHVGDCFGPCFFACPAHMDVPLMLRRIGREELREAIATVKRDIALPAVLGRVCSKPCEKACRRHLADGPVAVCGLKRFVADRDLASGDPYMPPCKPAGGKRVAIVGAGPTGLSAAYYLVQQGHAVVLLDRAANPGGRLRTQTTEDDLPRDVLDAEIDLILRLGAEFRPSTSVDESPAFDQLRYRFDAVLVACGRVDSRQTESWGLHTGRRGIEITTGTFETNLPGVFAAGGAIRPSGLLVRSIADGKEAAAAIDAFLTAGHARPTAKIFSSRIKRVTADEIPEFLKHSGPSPRREPGVDAAYTLPLALEQAERCLQCGCISQGNCKLEHFAKMYGAEPDRFGSQRRVYAVDARNSSVVFEPGKCIKCGLCIQIAEAAAEPLGLAFVGRGFDVKLGVPFGGSLDEALQKVAQECIAACPTGALSEADRYSISRVRH